MKIIALLLLLLVSVVATAQEKPQETEKTVTASEPAAEPRVDDGSIKLFLDKIEVVGQLEKPQAVFIIPGSAPEIDDIRIERSFFKEIFRTVEKRGQIIPKTSVEKKERKNYIPW
ncbi:MAG TPA: hypothetical protein PKN04_12445 [bacterium]|nr:hypothetical protein [bacterium]HNT66582.1 hypothetical protein [bacterium]HOX86390.1 hypothetical protein [bacterium]HPG45781.1 hypothetical protein [bacterium]HPM97992.1 hypothetical protein [bacterium]